MMPISECVWFSVLLAESCLIVFISGRCMCDETVVPLCKEKDEHPECQHNQLKQQEEVHHLHTCRRTFKSLWYCMHIELTAAAMIISPPSNDATIAAPINVNAESAPVIQMSYIDSMPLVIIL